MNCPNNPEHKVMLVEYGYGSEHRYDGVSEIRCETEDKRFCRWCKQELEKDEVAPRYCEGVGHPKINK